MSTLGVLGALAGGYSDAAKNRRDQNISLGEHQRDLQIGLLDKLLADPSTPEEYKGPLIQARLDTTHAQTRDKNGQLKLPSLDDLKTSLPPIQRPTQTTVQPPVQLQAPQPPPGAPAAALPPSGIQKPAGSASVPLAMPSPPPGMPSALQPPAPVTLPGQASSFQGPNISEAGQFHPLTHEEEAQREVQRAVAHRDALVAAGIDPARASIAAGLTPKPEFVHGAFGAPLFDAYTGKPLDPTGGAGQSRPKGTLQNFQTPDGMVSLQQVQTGDGKYHWEDPAGNAVVPDPSWTKIVPALLPTDRTSSSSDEFGVKSSTTSRSQKTVPGSKTLTKPTAPVSSETNGGGPTPATMREGTKKAVDDVIKAASDSRKQINLLDSAEKYVQDGKFDSAGDLSLIVQAVRAMNPGTVRLPVQEIQMELKRGTYGKQFERWYSKNIESGMLPPDQREELMNVLRRETTQVGQDAASVWKQTFAGKKPLPPHLQRFTQGGGNNTIVVVDPEGGKHTFADQAAADNFKKLAGIK